MPIDHSAVHVPQAQYDECLNFYLEALKPLGYEKRHQFGPTVTGLGSNDHGIPDYQQADFWVMGVNGSVSHTTHLAFRSKGKIRLQPPRV